MSKFNFWLAAGILDFEKNEKRFHMLVPRVKWYVHAKFCPNQMNGIEMPSQIDLVPPPSRLKAKKKICLVCIAAEANFFFTIRAEANFFFFFLYISTEIYWKKKFFQFRTDFVICRNGGVIGSSGIVYIMCQCWQRLQWTLWPDPHNVLILVRRCMAAREFCVGSGNQSLRLAT